MPTTTSLPITSPRLLNLFLETRSYSEELCLPLTVEDHVIQTMTDVSPPKWHLAHTSWFFEEFILKEYAPNYKEFHPQFNFIFNSYYKSVGNHVKRPNRGFLSRPSIEEVHDYRKHVTDAIAELWEHPIPQRDKNWQKLLTLGIQHEKQHQELLLTDIKYNFYCNPLYPAYHNHPLSMTMPNNTTAKSPIELRFIPFTHSLEYYGHNGQDKHGNDAFCYDNEMPIHQVYLNEFAFANRLITCKEYLEFIEDGGYQDFRHWFADAWDLIQKKQWQSPLYWRKQDNQWEIFTLAGFRPLNGNEPVCHLSYYEACAYAQWTGKRLPTEFEWEQAAKQETNNSPIVQLTHQLWQWTASSYLPYPNFRPLPAALGEYNGKFMCDQMVLRGGSWFSPKDHLRITYRNFLQPEKRWQLSGLRLAESLA